MGDFKVNKASLIIVIVIVGLLLIGIGKRYISFSQYQGEWRQYDSGEYSQTNTFPDGFRFEHPENWEVTSYEDGATKNGKELRVSLRKPNYIFTPSTGLQIWWRRVDDNWTLEDSKNWYVGDIAFGVDNTELEQKQDSFREVEIGKDNYPALVQTFKRFAGENPTRQVFLLVIRDEAFAFSFYTDNYEEDVAITFERMIGSLEIYR